MYDDEAGEKKPNHEFLKTHFFQEGRLTEEQALCILEHATKIFSREPNMVPVKSPVTSAFGFFSSSSSRILKGGV